MTDIWVHKASNGLGVAIVTEDVEHRQEILVFWEEVDGVLKEIRRYQRDHERKELVARDRARLNAWNKRQAEEE